MCIPSPLLPVFDLDYVSKSDECPSIIPPFFLSIPDRELSLSLSSLPIPRLFPLLFFPHLVDIRFIQISTVLVFSTLSWNHPNVLVSCSFTEAHPTLHSFTPFHFMLPSLSPLSPPPFFSTFSCQREPSIGARGSRGAHCFCPTNVLSRPMSILELMKGDKSSRGCRR